MKPASRLVDALGKLSAGVWDGENHGCSRQVVPLVEHGIEGHAPSLVTHCDPAIARNTDPDVLAKARDGLVYSIIKCLPQEMQQARRGRGAYIHAWAMADGCNALKHLNIGG